MADSRWVPFAGLAASCGILAVALASAGLYRWLEVVLVGAALLGVVVGLVGAIYSIVQIRRRAASQPQRPLARDQESATEEPESSKALFSIRLPRPPRTGNIDSYKTAHFDEVLISVLTPEGRMLRFTLTMPEKSFLDFGEFQAIYQARPYIHGSFFSNPLDISRGRQASLAFVHRPSSTGVSQVFTLDIHDVQAQQHYQIDALGEITCYDDGSTVVA